MPADLTQIIQILRREHIFSGLETDEIARVARFFEQVEVEKGRIIFRQGEQADYFYLILNGQVGQTRESRGKTRQFSLLGPGDYLGESSLLFRLPRSSTAEAMVNTTLLRLSPNRFQLLLTEYPQIRMNLSATADSRKLVKKIHFDWLGPDEVIYYVSRKHVFFLFLRLFLPLLLIGLGIIAIGFLAPSGYQIEKALSIVGISFAVILWGVWIWIDWSNDFYIITSQRVVRQDKVLIFSDSRYEAPLDTVMAVNVSSDQIGRIFDYGDVEVRTYTGSLMLRRTNQPTRFAAFVEGYRKRINAISKEKERQLFEEQLERAFNPSLQDANAAPTIKVPVSHVQTKPPPQTRSFLSRIFGTFLRVRYEEGDVITYRKHWFILVRKTWLSLLSIGVFSVIVTYLFQSDVTISALPCLTVATYAALFSWLIYQYLDWNNDIYRLTPESILDIEKKPLGREQKKTAALDAPDFRVEHTRESLLNILMNFGTVTVSIGQTQFVFYGVYNPDQVHQDVADYREAYIRRKRQDEARRERERMVEMLVSYRNKTGKLEDGEKPSGSVRESG